MTSLCPALGALLATCLAFSPLPAIKKAKEVKSLTANPLPYPAMFANCTNWVAYAFITKDQYVFIGNLPGMVMGLYYTITAFDLSKNKDHRRMVRRLVYGYAFFFPLMAAILAICIEDHHLTQQVVAYFSMVFLIVFYAAPLTELKQVIQEKNASSLDIRLAYCSLANAVMWTIYGIALNDVCIWVPNGIGAALSVLQVSLKCVFPSVILDDLNVTPVLVLHPKGIAAKKVKNINGTEALDTLLVPVIEALKLQNADSIIKQIVEALCDPNIAAEVNRRVLHLQGAASKLSQHPIQQQTVEILDDVKGSDMTFSELVKNEYTGTANTSDAKAFVDGTEVAFCVTDRSGVIYSCSEKFLEITGYSLYEMCGVNCNKLQRDPKGISRTCPKAIQGIAEATRQGKEHHVVLYNYAKNGIPFWNHLHLYPMKSASGEVTRYIGVQEPIKEKEALGRGGRVFHPGP